MNTDRIRCTEAREKLPLFVGGDLDPDVQAGVRAHLEGCPECAALAAAASRGRRALVDALLERSDAGTQPELWSGIRAVLVSEGRIRGANSPVHRESVASPLAADGRGRRPWRRLLAPLAAAAAVVLVVQAGLFSGGDDPAGPGKPHAAVSAPLVHVDGVVPVSAPVAEAEVPRVGALERVPAEEAGRTRMLVPFRRPSAEPQGPGDPGISLTGYH